jgi:hypothetical protein
MGKILILEDWLRSCGMYLYIVFFVLSASVMRGRTVYRETGRKKKGEKKRRKGER